MKNEIRIDYERVFSRAQEANEVYILENNLFTLYHLNRYNYEVRRLFHNRYLEPLDKMRIFEKLFGNTASNIFYELLYILISHKMSNKIYSIYNGYSKIVYKKLNTIILQIFTPIKLPYQTILELKPKFEKILKCKIILKNFVDEELLGGIVIKMPTGKIYDFSIKQTLTNLKYYILEKQI